MVLEEGMNVLGIDLAAQPERTGVVVLETAGDRTSLHPVSDRATDDVLVELAKTVDVVGVDAPLGYTGRWPLSVSADKLGIVAMRCALLQERFAAQVWEGQRQPRNGRSRLVETYPAGALHVWGLPRNGYKETRNTLGPYAQ
jgi:hypothetical protein